MLVRYLTIQIQKRHLGAIIRNDGYKCEYVTFSAFVN